MKKITLILLLASFSTSVVADMENDKNAGVCAAYLYIASNAGANTYGKTADNALNMADNSARAGQFGANWMDEIKRLQARKESLDSLFFDAKLKCRKIGIKLY